MKMNRVATFFGSKSFLIVLLFLFVLSASSYFFAPEIELCYWKIRCRNPVTWANVKVEFPDGVAYRKDDESIRFFRPDDPDVYLVIARTSLGETGIDCFIRNLEDDGYEVLGTEKVLFKKYDSFAVSFQSEANEFHKTIYVFTKEISISYIGKKEGCDRFTASLVEGIEFL